MATLQFQVLDELAEERSTYSIVAEFSDEAGNPMAPNVLYWSLYKGRDVVVNNRYQIGITPAASVEIVLSGADLALVRGETRNRVLIIEGTYDSDVGLGLPLKDAVRFTIKDLKGVL